MSGIYIPGIKMPKNCFFCNFSYMRGERLFCNLTKEEVLRAKIASDCPLIAVPDHGRLIDADAFEKLECNQCDGACDVVECDCTNCDSDCRCDFMLDLHNAPTIIPADKGGDSDV